MYSIKLVTTISSLKLVSHHRIKQLAADNSEFRSRLMSSEITPDLLAAGPFEDDGHKSLGGLHVTIARHTKFHRLISLTRHLNIGSLATGSDAVQREWLVDGQPVPDLDEAARRLSVSPQLTDDEILVLEKVSEAWTELSEMKRTFPETHRPKISSILVKLHLKGLVESQFRTVSQRSVPLIRRTPISPTD